MKFFASIFALCLALGFVACGNDSSTTTEPKSETAQQTNSKASKAPSNSAESQLATRAPKEVWERTEPKIEARSGPPPKRVMVKDLTKGTGAVIEEGRPFGVNWTAVYYKTGKWRESSWDTGKNTPLITASIKLSKAGKRA